MEKRWSRSWVSCGGYVGRSHTRMVYDLQRHFHPWWDAGRWIHEHLERPVGTAGSQVIRAVRVCRHRAPADSAFGLAVAGSCGVAVGCWPAAG
eukprot:scaffold2830_cov123-Isochrysis_galbana.AAC.18